VKRILIDISHVGKACLYVATDNAYKVTFEGKEVSIPRGEDGYEVFLMSFRKTLRELNMTPQQCILVADGRSCKQMRRSFLPGYCERPAGPKEFMEEFYKMQDMIVKTLLSYGAIYVDKEYVEADDIIFHLAEKLDCCVWSGDNDLLACAAPVYYDGFKDTSKFLGIPKDTIVVWKSLVGDPSDKIPAAKGFGKEAFRSMLEKYGDSCLYDIKGMLEDEALDELKAHVADFKPFQKILDNQETVYNSYKCAKFYHPGYKLNWSMAYPSGDGVFNEWKPVIKLITAKDLSEEFLMEFKKQLSIAPFNSLDIETSMTEAGLAWSEANKKSNDKDGPLDVFGAVLAGVSITTGSNNHLTYYFSVDHKDTDNLTLDQMRDILNLLPEDKPLIVHNTSYELPILREHFELRFDRGYLPPLTYDSRILAGYVNENVSAGLKFWSRELLGYDQVKYEDLMITDGIKYQMHQKTGGEVLAYAADDTITTSALFRFEEVFTKYEDSFDGYCKVDLPAQFMYAEAFRNGVKFDMEKLKVLREENSEIYKELLCNIQEFLADLKWIEYEKAPITVDMVRQGNFIAETKEIVRQWPGCQYVPADKLSVPEIKRLYKIYYGVPLETSARSIGKLVDSMPDGEFKKSVDDLDKLNIIVEQKFQPQADINLRSPKQLSELLYGVLGFPIRLRNKVTDKQRAEGKREGNASTDDSAFAHAIAEDANEEQKVFLKNILAAKSCLTEESLFFSSYETLSHWRDNLVHPQSGQAMATSGRANYNSPNVSQLSHKSPVRKVLVPKYETHVWVSMDLSSQELLIAACESQDENMLSCFKGERRDIHSLTGTKIWNIDNTPELTYEEFMSILKDKNHHLNSRVKDIRKRKAKGCNFLRNYLGTAKTLAVNLLITEAEAQRILTAAEEMFPDVTVWQNKVISEAENLGYVTEPMGRRKHLVLEGNWKDKHTLRSSVNFKIQASAAAQVKLIIGEIWKQRILDKFEAYFMFSVHDQIDFSVRKDQVIDFIRTVHPIVTQPFANYGVEIQSSIEIGKDFGSLIEIGVEFDEEKIGKVLSKL